MCQLEVTKYEEMEEASAELKLKQLLWDSIAQWDALVAEWMEVGRNLSHIADSLSSEISSELIWLKNLP